MDDDYILENAKERERLFRLTAGLKDRDLVCRVGKSSTGAHISIRSRTRSVSFEMESLLPFSFTLTLSLFPNNLSANESMNVNGSGSESGSEVPVRCVCVFPFNIVSGQSDVVLWAGESARTALRK
jgi:hypothetical protein